MDDQRIEARPVLGGEDLGYRFVLCRIGAKSIDGLGREGDELAFDQGLGGMGNGLGQMSFPVAI